MLVLQLDTMECMAAENDDEDVQGLLDDGIVDGVSNMSLVPSLDGVSNISMDGLHTRELPPIGCFCFLDRLRRAKRRRDTFNVHDYKPCG